MNDYYTVPINDKLLTENGFIKDDQGRYEKIVRQHNTFFEPLNRCECGKPIILYRELYLSNGTIQIHAVCSRNHQTSIKVKRDAKQFAKKVKFHDI